MSATNEHLSEDVVPVKLKRLIDSAGNGDGLEITWSDGTSSQLSGRSLRVNCPCASCNERRGDTSHAKPLGGGRASLRVLKSTIDEEINLAEIWAVGNYAIGIRWGDRHDSGIYSYAMLRELSKPTEK